MSDVLQLDRISSQRALEALRNGVPNGDAVRALGCAQPSVLDRFENQLAELTAGDGDQLATTHGALVSGGFGAGKSHLLEHLEQLALARGFVVSRIVVSKETPLYDLTRVFLAAVRDARVPDGRGPVIDELAQRMNYASSMATRFAQWAHQEPGMIDASLHLHDRSRDSDLLARIVDWWSGEKLGVAEVRAGLRQVGTDKTAFDVRAIRLRDLAPIRFEFAARLARAVGLQGWVLLIDEVELVGRYSLQQRGRSYAELARWLGHDSLSIPGITAVATITDDFDIEVLQEKGDLGAIGDKLRAKGDEGAMLAARAEAGMHIIRNEQLRLIPPSETTLRETFDRVRAVYGVAYEWDPPELEIPTHAITARMRSFIRRWINEWDLRRLYPGRAVAIVEDEAEVGVGYEEDTSLEREDGENSESSSRADTDEYGEPDG
jgi:P-loop Domain of unknown function (DUF2791)